MGTAMAWSVMCHNHSLAVMDSSPKLQMMLRGNMLHCVCSSPHVAHDAERQHVALCAFILHVANDAERQHLAFHVFIPQVAHDAKRQNVALCVGISQR